jgi:hypothetical protein
MDRGELTTGSEMFGLDRFKAKLEGPAAAEDRGSTSAEDPSTKGCTLFEWPWLYSRSVRCTMSNTFAVGVEGKAVEAAPDCSPIGGETTVWVSALRF